MSRTTEYEAAHQTLPIANITNVRAQAQYITGPTPASIAIPTLFGNYGAHYYSIAADGAKTYVALSPVPSALMNEHLTGTPTLPLWPIPDGQKEEGFLIGGPALGGSGSWSGVSTGPSAAPVYLHHFTGASTTATGFIRIRRSSVGPGGNLSDYPLPGWVRGHYSK